MEDQVTTEQPTNGVQRNNQPRRKGPNGDQHQQSTGSRLHKLEKQVWELSADGARRAERNSREQAEAMGRINAALGQVVQAYTSSNNELVKTLQALSEELKARPVVTPSAQPIPLPLTSFDKFVKIGKGTLAFSAAITPILALVLQIKYGNLLVKAM